jgi:hypothetical protein
MSNQVTKEPEGKTESRPHRIRLPGFIKEEEIGLGDAIKRITYAMGIKPCVGCEKRAATLNRWTRFNDRIQEAKSSGTARDK